MVTAKVPTTETYSLASLQVQENTTMDTALLWILHRKCMVKVLIGRKCYVRLLNEKILKYF